jgi:hypothetical protein
MCSSRLVHSSLLSHNRNRSSGSTTGMSLPTTPQRNAYLAAAIRRDNGMPLDSLEAAVPSDQRPVNELLQLKGDVLYNWATLPASEYTKRLGLLWAGVSVLLSGPIADQTFSISSQPIQVCRHVACGERRGR